MTAKNLLRNEFYSLDLWSLATKGTQELNLIWATRSAYMTLRLRRMWPNQQLIMERPTSNIKNPKIRAYMEAVTEGKPTADKLTADEYEEGVSQFIDGLDTALAQADEMIARAKLGDVPEAISFNYIAKK